MFCLWAQTELFGDFAKNFIHIHVLMQHVRAIKFRCLQFFCLFIAFKDHLREPKSCFQSDRDDSLPFNVVQASWLPQRTSSRLFSQQRESKVERKSFQLKLRENSETQSGTDCCGLRFHLPFTLHRTDSPFSIIKLRPEAFVYSFSSKSYPFVGPDTFRPWIR